ncbi:Diphthamide synthesis DPH1/DPH2 [Vigna unguiculata]|uniref:Diphthamide synthesis DPH1/DPH2 n=1 Tax=Vigna unguiculata TaxID=3917 RepID=A0A4D6M7H9_VIGUN|nr:Diphthamide synthesis DPH1/DPH2 [Vigna unguiculata]
MAVSYDEFRSSKWIVVFSEIESEKYVGFVMFNMFTQYMFCLLYTSPRISEFRSSKWIVVFSEIESEKYVGFVMFNMFTQYMFVIQSLYINMVFLNVQFFIALGIVINSIGGEFHMISWEIQGGFFFLETTSLPMAIDSYSSYICCIGNLTSDAKLPKKGTKWEQNVRENYTSDDVIDRGANSTSQQAASRLPEACDFSLSQFAFVLAHENESGCIQEIVVEVISHQNHILKNLRAFLTLERPDNGVMLLSRCWFGTGSLFGFDITLSISEIQTIMSMSSSLSEVASQNTIKKLEKNDWSYSHEVDNCLEAMIPDGAIVAIQDVNQHMYFTVEVKYDANENQMVTDLFQQRRILKRRYYLVERAKDANIVGILVGTLGVDGAGYLHIINQMKELITRAGKKAYTLVMGKSNPAKLANFPEEFSFWDILILFFLFRIAKSGY